MSSRRTLVIGDVHGCSDELARLLREVGHTAADRVIFVGDLVAKGPDSVGVLRIARSIGAEAVMGNHDHYLVEHHRSISKDGTSKDGASKSGADASDAIKKLAKKLSDDDWRWLEALPYTVTIPDHGALVVHAGLVPGVPIDQQKPENMLQMRSIKKDGTASKRIEEGVPWASVWVGPPHVYFGHDAVRGLQRYDHATGLDTACVYGGRLTACVLPERALVSVQAAQMYSVPGKTIAARHDAELVEVEPDGDRKR